MGSSVKFAVNNTMQKIIVLGISQTPGRYGIKEIIFYRHPHWQGEETSLENARIHYSPICHLPLSLPARRATQIPQLDTILVSPYKTPCHKAHCIYTLPPSHSSHRTPGVFMDALTFYLRPYAPHRLYTPVPSRSHNFTAHDVALGASTVRGTYHF